MAQPSLTTEEAMDASNLPLPPMKDLTIENITANVHAMNSRCPDPRTRYLFDRLITHLHDFARETRLSTAEWTAAIQFLTSVGQICTDIRQEFILLSDVLGFSILVNSIDHPTPPTATEGTVLGPFHTHDAEPAAAGDRISSDPDGEPVLVVGSVKDVAGKALAGVKVDVWEGDSKGFYDVQYAERRTPDGRAVLESDGLGRFWFKAIVPVPYPIPHDGPVGKLLDMLQRHPYRPGHMHFMFEKEGFDRLITALYLRGDPYESSDAVFGVKESLLIDVQEVTDVDMARRCDVPLKSKLITYDFVLVPDAEARALKEREAGMAMETQGRKMKYYRGLPVPDVD